MEEQNNQQFEQQTTTPETVEVTPNAKKGSFKLPLILISLGVIVIAVTAFIFAGSLLGDKTSKHTHNYGEWDIIQEASCSIEGKKERYCACGEKQESNLPKVAHTFTSFTVIKNATCKEEGVKQQICSTCSQTITESIPKTNDHTLTTLPAVAATCTSTGLTEGKKCTVCDKITLQQTVTATIAHNYSSFVVTKEANCKEEGTKKQTCSVCSKTITESIPKTNDHTLITIPAVAATCTDTGLTEGKKCTTCGKTTVEQTVTPITAHNLYETIINKATSTQAGTKQTACSTCSYSKTESYTLKLLSSEEVYALAEKSVGEITTYKKNGSGLSLGTAFVYSSDGKLITNYHVIEGAYSAKVTLNGTSYNVTKILAYDKDIDIAVLQINATGLNSVSIQTEDIKGGATVYAVGSSEGYTLSFSTGVIASPERIFDGVKYIQHEAAISHGNSGGPLFNAYGEVIGINTLTNIDGQNLNFAIACSELDNISYSNPLTFSQFYEKESDPFTLVMNYAIENGTYDSEDDEYTVLLKKDYSSDYTSVFYFYVDYCASDDELKFYLFTDSSSDYMVTFIVDRSLSGYYDWTYIDSYNYYMSGTITARTYTNNTLLGYSYNNISYSSLRTSVRKLASSATNLIIMVIDMDLYSATGVDAYDLGFVSY